jgi:TATA-box binding protein (TBP) (component of TFIID and TFIIIB)
MASIRTVNLVVTTDLEHKLNLEKIAATLHNTEYNPDQFPGLITRVKEPKKRLFARSSILSRKWMSM